MMHQRKELRLRDWLKEMIDVGQFYGLKWEDRSRHGWSEKDDAALFRAWATCTKKNKDPRKWKTNFILPDIKEIREESCPRGKDAYKIYKMQPVRGRGKGFATQRCLAHC